MRFIIFLLCAVLYFESVPIFAYENNIDGSLKCSDWAKNEIIRAIEIGLIPKDMQKDYTNPITREEFCILIVNMLSTLNNDIMNFCDAENIFYEDTDNDAVVSASGLGIVSGVGNNKFNPNGSITRQEASRMLYMTSTLGKRYPKINKYLSEKINNMNNSAIMPHIFRDGAKIQNWAQESINYCYMYGIMQGIDYNLFDVSGTYSREQSYITILRLYDLYKNGEISIPDRNCIYRKKENKDGTEMWGYINEKNQWVIEPDSFNDPIYDAGEFKGNYAMADMGSAAGLRIINKNGDIVLGGFRHGTKFGDIVSFENNKGTVNLNTGDIIGMESWLTGLKSGAGETLTAIQDINTKLYGYYNTEGNLVIAKKYQEAYTFYNNRAIVKENDRYKLIDRFGNTIIDFDISLKNTEYIDNAVGDIYIVLKKGEYQNEFCYMAQAGKGIIIDNNKKNIQVRLMLSGDINVIDENDSTLNIICDRKGNTIFTADSIDNIIYNESSDVYITIPPFSNVREDRIFSRLGKEIITVDYNKYEIIGNGMLCAFNENNIFIYNNAGKITKTINIENNIKEIYSDNGIIFVYDVNDNFKGFTYLGEEII